MEGIFRIAPRNTMIPRRVLSLAATAAVSVAGCLGSAVSAAKDDTLARNGEELRVTERYTLPIAEVSGLALVRGGAQSVHLYAIGDASYKVARCSPSRSSNEVSGGRCPAPKNLGKSAKGPSQWEAIAADGKDSICILSELTRDVSCLGRDLKRERAHFRLDVSSIKGLKDLWKATRNSGGEGMILMKKGHVLLLKEKKPSMLIEYGPKGAAPMGYGQGTFLEGREAFAQPPSGSRLMALKAWEFSESLAALAKDASDMTLGPDGLVYILSQESATLIRLEEVLKPDEASVHESAFWRLPAELETAEGLAIDDEMHPWVAVDIKQTDKPNLFRLTPIEATRSPP